MIHPIDIELVLMNYMVELDQTPMPEAHRLAKLEAVAEIRILLDELMSKSHKAES